MVYIPGEFGLNFNQFLAELKAGKYHPIYFFQGKEDYLAESGMNQLIEKLIPPEDHVLNLSIFHGDDAQNLPNVLSSPPVLAKRRVTVVRNTEALPPKTTEFIVSYSRKPPSDSVLIMLATDVDMRKKFFKEMKDLVEVVECARLNSKELMSWMKNYADIYNKKLDKDAIDRLSSIHWPSIRELAMELDRLMLMVGDSPSVNLKDIEDMGGGSFALDRWRLNDAVLSGNQEIALNVLQNLLFWSLKPTQIIGDLFRLYHNLWILKWLIIQRKTKQARKELGIPEFLITRYSEKLQRMLSSTIEKGLLRILEADLNIKRGIRSGEREIVLLTTELVGKWKT